MRDPENIRDVGKLGIDMMGFNFCKDDPRHVGMIASLAAIIPDYADRRLIAENNSPRRVGVLPTTCRRTSSLLYIITSSIVFNFKAASRQ